jgi:enamine deaminase RidA (YjgF/YER057c/UK114 family)
MTKDERPTILQPPGWPKPRGYANGMVAEGRIVVTGGMIGCDEKGALPQGFPAQLAQALSNIRAVLAEAGAQPHHLVRLTWYLLDIDEYLGNLKEIGRVYRDIIGSHFPAMAVVQVARLVEPMARLEIEATAVLPHQD